MFVRKVPGVFGEKCPSISNPRRGEEHTPRQIPPDRIKNQARIKKSKKKARVHAQRIYFQNTSTPTH